jgi:quinoprotein glucose dehydrogenase
VVRAYDARTGELRWAWDALRPDPQAPLAQGEIYPRGTPNVWNAISADESLGLAFLATGNAAADQWGGNRTPEEDRFTDAVVAVDLATGATRWVVHDGQHDCGTTTSARSRCWWTSRSTAPRGARSCRAARPATCSCSTRRPASRCGRSSSVRRRRAAAPGDWVSPTQPQSVFYPNIGGVPGRDPEQIDARHAFGLTPIDAALCRISFHRMRYEGMYTPPTVEGDGMLLFPGTVGGMNWGGAASTPSGGWSSPTIRACRTW